MGAGQEAVAPETSVERLINAVLGNEHYERGKILIGTAESITEPCAHGRTSCKLRAGLKKCDGGIVIDGFGVERFDEAELIRHFCGPRHQIAHPGTTVAV